MIFVVSTSIATEESALLDPIAPVTLESSDDRVKDDDVSKELLDATSAEELGVTADETGMVSEELDSSTALLSVFSGTALLPSSPQATNSTAAVIRAIFPRYLLKGFVII